MRSLVDIARATTAEHDLLPPGTVVLAMVSGGADSVALLRLLAAGELGEGADVSALHVNHLLRGADSDADAAFVQSLCGSLGVPCAVVRYDVAAFARDDGLNLEDAGRRVRYAFADRELDRRCEALGVPRAKGRVAVAHTLDDQTETFLMRLVTGAGQSGLRAMAPIRGRVVRPLLGARRAEVTAYLASLGQGWREDATNADTERLRAWVRHELKPLIEGVNPAFPQTLERTVRLVADEDALLAEMADAFAHDFASLAGGRLAFDRVLMATLSPAMARRVVRTAVEDAFPEASRLEADHVEALVAGLHDARFARDLPFGLRAEVEYGTLTLFRRGDESPAVAPCLLEWPGRCDLGPLGAIEARYVGRDVVGTGPGSAYFDADSLGRALVVDRVRDGDRMRPLGSSGSRKVQDVLVDAKVARRLRASTPVVRDGDRVLWVAGVRQAEECKVTPSTTRILALEWLREGT